MEMAPSVPRSVASGRRTSSEGDFSSRCHRDSVRRRIGAPADGDDHFAPGDLLELFDQVAVDRVAGAHHTDNLSVFDLLRGAQIGPAAALLDAVVGQVARSLQEPLNVFGQGRPVAVHGRVVNAEENFTGRIEDLDEIHLHRADQREELLKERGAVVFPERVSDPRHLRYPVDQPGRRFLSFAEQQLDLLGLRRGFFRELTLENGRQGLRGPEDRQAHGQEDDHQGGEQELVEQALHRLASP